MTTSTRAVIYRRVSTLSQEDNYSLATQHASCEAHAAALGWTVIDSISEVASGTTRNRGGLNRALSHIESGAADVLIVHALDRLSRDQVDVAVLMDRIESAGGVVVSTTEDLETSAVGVFLR